jgi:hypothetical protein
VRNFGEEGRGGISRGVSSRGNNQGDEAGHGGNGKQEQCEMFHGGSFLATIKAQGRILNNWTMASVGR